MKTLIRHTLIATAFAFSTAHASPWSIGDAEGVVYPPSMANTQFSGQFDKPLSFSQLDSDGHVSQAAIFGEVKPTMATKASPYIGTSERPFSWNNVPNPDLSTGD